MEKKGHFLFVVLLALLAFSATAQDNNVFIEKDHNPELKVTVTGYFGISLMTTYTGFVRYGYIQPRGLPEINSYNKQVDKFSPKEFPERRICLRRRALKKSLLKIYGNFVMLNIPTMAVKNWAGQVCHMLQARASGVS